MQFKKITSKKYLDFQRDWYAQASSATMSSDGTRTACSDAVDATGHYIWRENGAKNGRCYGIDFRQAAQIWSQNDKCGNSDPICQSAAITLYVPFAYDAAIALAHGLHELLYVDGIRPDEITEKALSDAIRNSTFEGVSGNVSFSDKGDRRPEDLQFFVYRYDETSTEGGLVPVGRMKGGVFENKCGEEDCAPFIYPSDVVRV